MNYDRKSLFLETEVSLNRLKRSKVFWVTLPILAVIVGLINYFIARTSLSNLIDNGVDSYYQIYLYVSLIIFYGLGLFFTANYFFKTSLEELILPITRRDFYWNKSQLFAMSVLLIGLCTILPILLPAATNTQSIILTTIFVIYASVFAGFMGLLAGVVFQVIFPNKYMFYAMSAISLFLVAKLFATFNSITFLQLIISSSNINGMIFSIVVIMVLLITMCIALDYLLKYVPYRKYHDLLRPVSNLFIKRPMGSAYNTLEAITNSNFIFPLKSKGFIVEFFSLGAISIITMWLMSRYNTQFIYLNYAVLGLIVALWGGVTSFKFGTRAADFDQKFSFMPIKSKDVAFGYFYPSLSILLTIILFISYPITSNYSLGNAVLHFILLGMTVVLTNILFFAGGIRFQDDSSSTKHTLFRLGSLLVTMIFSLLIASAISFNSIFFDIALILILGVFLIPYANIALNTDKA